MKLPHGQSSFDLLEPPSLPAGACPGKGGGSASSRGIEDMIEDFQRKVRGEAWRAELLCFGAFCLAVRTLTFCQLIGFPLNH